MIVPIQIDDDLGASYQEEAAERNLTLGQVLADRLARAGELDPRGRYVIVAGNPRDRLEQALGGGHVRSSEELVQKVQRLARIKFGDHTIPITPGQMEELIHRASRRGKTVDQLIEEIWVKISPDFFNHAG